MTLTPEQLAKSDEEFEAMMRDKYPFHSLKKLHDGSAYLDADTFWIHKGWSLRQQSLVFELPFETKDVSPYVYVVYSDDLIENLQSAGINYREKE